MPVSAFFRVRDVCSKDPPLGLRVSGVRFVTIGGSCKDGFRPVGAQVVHLALEG